MAQISTRNLLALEMPLFNSFGNLSCLKDVTKAGGVMRFEATDIASKQGGATTTERALRPKSQSEKRTRVTCLGAHRTGQNTKSPYATRDDFRRLFGDDANGLYLLSFLLTARHEMAKRCFEAGLSECVEGNAVFQDWARSWARRVIIRNAIRIMEPRPRQTRATPAALNLAGYLPGMRLQNSPFANILELEDFERFVYVLSVLEEYVDQNCAALLNTSQREIREARDRALRHLSDLAISDAAPSGKLSIERVA
jgi:hypothetical protein